MHYLNRGSAPLSHRLGFAAAGRRRRRPKSEGPNIADMQKAGGPKSTYIVKDEVPCRVVSLLQRSDSEFQTQAPCSNLILF